MTMIDGAARKLPGVIKTPLAWALKVALFVADHLAPIPPDPPPDRTPSGNHVANITYHCD